MSKSAKVALICGSVVVLLGLAIVFFGPGKGDHTIHPVSPDDTTSSSNASHPARNGNSAVDTPHSTGAPSDPPPDSSASTPEMADWSAKVDNILTSDVSESDKARQLLDMFPNLPEAGQVDVANHISNLLANEDYARAAGILTNASTSPEVLDVFLRDALNRPNSLKLPVLLEVARNPQHPKAGEAKETLVLFLDEDDGEDWAKWQAKMDEWLKANPD